MIPHRLHSIWRRLWPMGSSSRSFLTSQIRHKGLPDEEDEEDRLQTQKYEGIRTQYLLPDGGHRVFLVQPARHERRRLTLDKAAELMEEARALVDSLETWQIVDEVQVSLRHKTHEVLFTPGVFEDLTRAIRARPEATAVFLNWPMLTGLQLAALQKAWARLVYDRFTLVLQIFRLHARSREARLQVALAELPYLRSRLAGLHSGSLGAEMGESVAPLPAESPLAVKMQFLEAHEQRLRQRLGKLEEKREFLRRRRRHSEKPLVTVVGYTNAGKTSLIREWTTDERVVPSDKLFATLDTSNHGALLPNNLRVILVDTIGFLSDIPTSLLAAFRATLRDCMDTDLLIHVVDVSHPQCRTQMATVHKILGELDLPARLTASMVEIGNKSDKAPAAEVERFQEEFPTVTMVSCRTGEGLKEMQAAVQEALMENLGLVRKRLKVRIGGTVYDWLHGEATVENFETCDDDLNKAIVTVIFTPAALSRFKAKFDGAKARWRKL